MDNGTAVQEHARPSSLYLCSHQCQAAFPSPSASFRISGLICAMQRADRHAWPIASAPRHAVFSEG